MAFTLPKTITPGTNENAADVQANDAALRDEFNAVTQTATLVGAQLQNKTVTATQIADNTISTSQIAGGGVYADNIRSSDNDKLGLSSTGVVRRGATNIATTESRTNTAYGTLATPDQVSSVVLPSNGLIAVAYQATWQESSGGASRAAIFVGLNQMKIAYDNNAGAALGSVTQAAVNNGTPARDQVLTTVPGLGLASTRASVAYSGDATTGQVMGAFVNAWTTELGGSGVSIGPISYSAGGPVFIFAAAGTYDVSVQFKASSGSVTAKNRKLWVWTIGF